MVTYCIITIFSNACQKPLPPAGDAFWQTAFERSKGLETETYDSGIAYLEKLAQAYPQLTLRTYGTTDAGLPLHLAILSPSKQFDALALRQQGKAIMLINNAIHPGEPDGVDASLRLLRNLLQDGKLEERMGNTVLAVIPFYNIGGVLNRNTDSRANQEGPESYGFRGNSQYLDLNRDFIKADSRNAFAFAEIFQEWQPDVFIDTHVSNGADYQYTLTCLVTQEQKLGGKLGEYLRGNMLPSLYKSMEARKEGMIPYVNVWGTVPDSGYAQFHDSPRYSTGYAALFNTIGFMTETHMLKPFKQRVEATQSFLEEALAYLNANAKEIRQLRQDAIKADQAKQRFPIRWKLNREIAIDMPFKGYEASYIPSEVTTGQRLFYDRAKPFEKNIKYFNHYEESEWAEKPQAYIIPQGWHRVIERLKANGIAMEALAADTALDVAVYKILSCEATKQPYEGHFPQNKIVAAEEKQRISFRKGDWLIRTGQVRDRFLMETLTPNAPDSYFVWNFFDAILQAKEGYSDYVFEDKAKAFLAADTALRSAFEAEKANNTEFANDPNAQLDFIYRRTKHAEPGYRRYPVYRVF